MTVKRTQLITFVRPVQLSYYEFKRLPNNHLFWVRSPGYRYIRKRFSHHYNSTTSLDGHSSFFTANENVLEHKLKQKLLDICIEDAKILIAKLVLLKKIFSHFERAIALAWNVYRFSVKRSFMHFSVR